MVKRFLITTALEETWRDDQPVLFLGEWCQRYSRRARRLRMDAEVMSYHWDDRAKFHSDYQELRDFYERLLPDLAAQLNQLHRVDHSVRYWRIVIGPWLGYFIQILFDRWTSIQQAVSMYHLSETVVLSGRAETMVPCDMRNFPRLFVGDEWNHHLYGAILQSFTDLPCVLRSRDDSVDPADAPLSVNRKGHRRSSLGEWYVRAAGVLSRESDAFLLDTSLSVRDEMRVHLRLGQFPQRWRTVPPIEVPVDTSQRRWVVRGDNRSEYERCARTLIPLQMPSIYLEGRRLLVEQIDQLPWPRRPTVIWTSTAEIADDVFKAWAAEKVEQGTPLVISQHGGHYGVGLWSFHEDHEVAISNRYLSWGWSEPTQPAVRPVGQLLSRESLRVRHATQSRALLMTVATPRYSYWMYSFMVARQWLDYFEDQCTFVGSLSASVQNALTVRLYPHDYGWDQLERWADRYPDVRLDTGHSPITDLIKQSRLYISTYNATTFLESFRMNVPTVIYWNPSRWELRDSAIPYFEDLKRVGILHDTPARAAHHASAIWDDVDAWWSRSDVREVLDRFKARYCSVPDDLLGRLNVNLREVMLERPGAISHHA